MKKRILSLLLACILLFSAIPMVSVPAEISAAENVISISSYSQFVDLFKDNNSAEGIEVKLTADIIVPDESEPMGKYNVKDFHLDGNGYSITGLKIEDFLFAGFENSSLKNLTFDSAVVNNSDPATIKKSAVVAQSIDQKSKIINCAFENCVINLPDINAEAAFVAVENGGFIINCTVENNSVISNSALNMMEYHIGGITATNKSKVINCVSKAQFDVKSDNNYTYIAGIAARNKGNVDLCYVNSLSAGEQPVVGDSSKINNSVYKKADGSFVMGTKSYSIEELKILAADMSHNAMNYIDNQKSNLKDSDDYPFLWCAKGNEPGLTSDVNSAQVYFIVDKSLDNAEISFSMGATEVSSPSGRWFLLTPGEYINGKYQRNRVDISLTLPEDEFKMVKSFVCSPSYTFIEDVVNPYDGTNYSRQFIPAKHNGNVNTASFEILPYSWGLSLNNLENNDELVPFEFYGKGTESDPYLISSKYDFDVFNSYVHDEGDSGIRYRSAYYRLTTDLSDIEIAPIGENKNGMAFTGGFDGGGHFISNLKVANKKESPDDKDTYNYRGMFGYVLGLEKPAVIKNLNIVNADVTTTGDICGIVVGQAENAVINGCVTSGKVSGGTQISGIVGYANNTQIYNCGTTAEIITANANASAGGVVGYAENSTVRNCYALYNISNTVVVKDEYIKTGGITGYFERTIFNNCFYNGKDYSGKSFYDACVAGIDSNYESVYFKLDDFLNTLTQYSSKAGFGTYWEKDLNSRNSGYPVIVVPDEMGLRVICVPTEAGTVTADNPTPKAGDIVTLTVHSDYELSELQITNLNREIVDVPYDAETNGTYVFRMPSYSVRVVPVFKADAHLAGMGTIDDPYIVSNFADLKLMSDKCFYNKPPRENCVEYPKAYYELVNDIDGGGQKLPPIGNNQNKFRGRFDGKDHTISNIVPYLNSGLSMEYHVEASVFGSCYDAIIHDIVFENIEVLNQSAVVASRCEGDTIICNVALRNCTLSSGLYMGGFAGEVYNLSLINCLAENLEIEYSVDSSCLAGMVYGNININNVYVLNCPTVRSLTGNSNGTATCENLYISNTSVVDESLLGNGSAGDWYTKIANDKQNDRHLAAELSENAYYVNLGQGFKDLDLWGISNKIELCGENGVIGILPIYYADEFDDPEAYNVFPERINEMEVGYIVEIPCTDVVDISRMKITTPTNRTVGYTIEENRDGQLVLKFVMPEEPVTITNGGVVPKLVDIPGSGTAEDPYRVSLAEQIMLISDVTNGLKQQYKNPADDVDYIKAQFVVLNDIDMSDYNWTNPIGTMEVPFEGVFDGKNFTISNLKSNSTSSEHFGFFGVANGATFRNINLDVDFDFYGGSNHYIGGMCGYVSAPYSYKTSHILNCTVSGTINVELANMVGGFTGYFENGNIGIEKCINKAEITCQKSNYFGGIVGLGRCIINNCANLGKLTTNDGYMGGIAGGDGSVHLLISNSYTVGQMSGEPFRWNEICYNLTQIKNSYYLNTVGNISQNSIRVYYSDGYKDITEFRSGQVTYLLNLGVTDGSQVWYQNVDNGYTPDDFPNFDKHNLNTVYKVDREDKEYSNILFNEDGIYEISCPEELIIFSHYVNSGGYSADAIVVADIDMAGYSFTPIGQTGLYYNSDPAEGQCKGYSGDFNGQGYVISNLIVKGSKTGDLSYGLFGTVSGTVKNIGLENFEYTGDGKDCRAGAVAGQVLTNGKIIDCYAKNVNINTQVNTTNGVAGGIAGANYAGEVSDCYAYNVNITAGRSGGIVADNFGDANNSNGTDRPGKVTNCYTNYSNICGRGTATGGLSSVTDSTFKSGEIVYNLVNGRTDSLWRQGSDKLPALKGDIIYKNICKDADFYSTSDKDYSSHSIDHNHGKVRCERCNHFDSATLITDDNYKALGLTADYVGMYAIENASNMYWISEKNVENPIRNGVVLLEDITIDSSVEEWKPMFVDYTDFTFDGRGHTLTLNLDFGSEQKSSDLALFATFNYGFIKDIVLKGSVIANTTANVGGLAGSAYRSTFEKVISYVDVTNNCETGGRAGGLAGYYGGQMDSANGYFSRILNCAVYADVKGYEAGGIVGHGWNGKQYYDIKNSAFVGDVRGFGYQGAIIGYHGNNQDARQCTFKDIYYNEADGLGFSGGGNTNYTLDSTVAVKTQAQFESGEVAYLLNGSKSDNVIWKQNIDNGKTKDTFPVHTGGTVYKNTTCIGEFIEYSNTADAVVHDYNNYYVCKKCIGLYPGKIAGIWGFDIGLSGSIELNYYMVIDKETAKDHTARMVFTVPDGTKENPDATYEVVVPVDEAEFDGTFYYFSCGIPAKEINSDIYCKLVTNTMESDTFRYSVKEYAEYILANPEVNEDAVPLVKSILNYGAYAQICLGYKTDDLANDSQFITEEEKLLPEVNFLPYNSLIVGEQKGVTFYGSMLTHLATTDIRLFFDFANPKDVDTLDITVNGEKVVPVKNGSYYEILIKGTPAQAYHLNHVVKIGGLTVYYNVFSYGASVQINNGKTETLNLSKSMYVYNREIIKYLEKQSTYERV